MRWLSSTAAVLLAAALSGGCSLAPTPITPDEASFLGRNSYERLTADQEPVSGPIDLYEAMARALKYNLDQRVEEAGAALRVKELDLADFNMLPNLVAGSGYAGRNNDNASNSLNILTGSQSLPYSTSQEHRSIASDVTFSWNILDFGLSYVRARQAADKFLVAQELRRKVMVRLVEDVRTAYWRAFSAERLVRKLGELEGRIRRAQGNARAASVDRQTSPITAATYERELVEIKRTIQELQRDLVVAKTQLAALMNLKPGTPFRLAGGTTGKGLKLVLSLNDLIATALTNRPELKEVWYEQRINRQELDAALLELLPGLTPYAGTNYDSNEFLYNSHWLSWGAKASWNLIKVVQYPAKRAVIEAQDRQLDVRALAVTMAVLTQVHVSRIRFMQYAKELETADEVLDVQRRLVGLMRSEAGAERISEQLLIREEMNALVAETKRDVAHAGLQNAYAGVYTSIGLDPFSSDVDLAGDVRSLAGKLRGIWGALGDGGAAGRTWAPAVVRRER